MIAPVGKTCTAIATAIKHYETSHGRVSYPENNPTNFGYIITLTQVADAYTGEKYDDFESQVYSKEKTIPNWYRDGIKIKFLVDVTKSNKPRIKKVIDLEKENEYKNNKEKGGGSSSTYNDPVSIKKSAFSAAQDISISFLAYLEKAPKDVYQLNRGAEIFNTWIMNNGKVEKRDDMINRFRALEKAVKMSEWLGIHTPDELIEVAEQLMIPLSQIDEDTDE